MALQLVTGLVFSLLLNLPVLLVRGGPGRVAAFVVLAALLVGAVVSAARPRGRDGTVRITRSGVATGPMGLQRHAGGPDPHAVLARWQRFRRIAHLQLPALALGLLIGSVVGVLVGPWWAEVLGGAVGYGLVIVLIFRLVFPREVWKAAGPG